MPLKLTDKQKRMILIGGFIVAVLIALWLLFGRKFLRVPTSSELAPEAVRDGGTTETPNYLTFNLPPPAEPINVQKQPAAVATQCCSQAPTCGCAGDSALLTTTNALIDQYNKQTQNWADSYYAQLQSSVPEFLQVQFTPVGTGTNG